MYDNLEGTRKMSIRNPIAEFAGNIPQRSVAVKTIDARDFGIYPGMDDSIRSELEIALNQVASESGSQLLLQAGDYNYDNTIDVSGGGGMVCMNGKAKLNARHPSYNRNAFSFTGSSSDYADGFKLDGIIFNNATMPDEGLSNGADENAGFIRLTYIRNIHVSNCEVEKNFGGFLLLRNCNDALIENNVCRDLWKDVFHTTGSSRNIWRINNRVYNCGDDAYATVGYLSQNSRPEYVYDFNNFVYGVRRGRAFAYVGAKHVRGMNFVDGRVVNPYQALSPNGHSYRGSCALYIASESGFGTFGCEDVKFHIDAEYMGPTVVSPGGGSVSASIESTNSLGVVRIAESGSDENRRVKDIEIRGTVKNSPRINVFATGCENLDLDMVLRDNTDTEGWVGTAGAYTAQAAEFQSLRGNNKIKVDIKTCNHIPIVFGGTSIGSLDLNVKINDVLKTMIHDALYIASGSNFDRLGITMDLDWDIPAGRLDRFVDLQCNFGQLDVNFKGNGSASNINSLITGASSSSIPMTSSPQIVTNMSDSDLTVQIKGGAVTTVEQSRVLMHHARPVASVSGNVLTISGDVSSQFLTTRHCVFLGGKMSPSEMGNAAIAISSVSFSGGNTSVTLASSPPIAGSYSRVAPLHTEGFAAVSGSLTRFLNLPRNRAFRITYTTAPAVNVIAAEQ